VRAVRQRKRGILLLAHGSIVEGVERELEAIAIILRQRTDVDVVQIGFLDYTEPKIPEAVESLVASRVSELLVMPYFLSSGYLLKKALRLVREEAAKHPPLVVHTAEHLGGHPRLVDVVIDRIEDARSR
jgi:sirohydrochlorin cobaltochelatase